MTRRYALKLEYNGRLFCGFQRQRDAVTVQGVLEDLLQRYTHRPITLHAAGRTDTGVHALGQVVHFDGPDDLDFMRLKGYLNHHALSLGLSIVEIRPVSDDFHARFSALQRFYRYVILNRQAPSTLWGERSAWVKTPLSLHAMQQAARFFIGSHNFDSFRSTQCQAQHAQRTLNLCDVTQSGDFITVHIASKSFLHNQVRIMVGSLISVGQGRHDPTWIQDLLNNPDRRHAGPTAPPYGLYFEKVDYPRDVLDPPFPVS